MAYRVFKSDLSVKGLRQLKKDLRAYQRQTLPNLMEQFVTELANEGVTVAKIHAGQFSPYLAFVVEIKDTKYNYKCTAVMVGQNAIPNIKTWFHDNELISREVNSLMMAEYGAGQFADPPKYRGTFPEQTHAKEDHWWYATEKDAEGKFIWHQAQGTIPTRPMLNARDAIIRRCNAVARRVFG